MKKIKKVNVHEQVSKEIQNYIQQHNLKEGDKLPSVEELTQMFGVGRSSLRESIIYLEAINVVRVENGKGIFVSEDVDMYRFSGKFKIEKEKRFLLDILDVRRAMEGKAVELAALRITPTQIQLLEECTLEMKTLKENNQDTSSVDFSFHRTIIQSAANPVLESVFDSMVDLNQKFFIDPLGNKQLFDATYPYHFTIFEAIKARDPKKALEEYMKHMDCIEQSIQSV
ncbi:GntR family transcriptional regulator, transcriptional repressor for pyruvate dehydrogenase complex [Paenibacillus catalpae]|uniref:GntR family transcriptional regulator, transcriptional repressor for pyruvate dehydrogenase complex n=1 Tax=Paenibacillus catalpae TaxID=1045775 RepID=A0A1I2BTD6_9BACL|nr:FadR/GntR family transcriptional regulator [Paenibacillus catalpae]SFE59349.1 GntR family transcriptional regulator, transcriptional repressor for pyruvate dehydrogenase complex [Paenibacillus catalpae]